MILADVFRPRQWTLFTGRNRRSHAHRLGSCRDVAKLQRDRRRRDPPFSCNQHADGNGAGVHALCAGTDGGAKPSVKWRRSLRHLRFVVSRICEGLRQCLTHEHWLRRSRIVGGNLLHSTEMAGATPFFFGYVPGLYIAAAAIVTITCQMIVAAWLSVIGAFDQGTA